MLLKYSFSNFRSVGLNPIVIDFEANTDKLLTDNLIDGKVNKACFIFGDNGVGKSSIVLSLQKLQEMILQPITKHERDIRNQQHVLFPDKPSTYEISYTVNGVKYDYSLSYLNSEILSESLFYSPNGRSTKIFTREKDLSSLSFSTAFEKDAKNCEGYFRSNRLVLSIAANVTQIQPIIEAFSLFEHIICFLESKPTQRIVQRVGEFLTEQPEFKEKFLLMLKTAGSDIEDIIIETRQEESRPMMRSYDEPNDFFEEAPYRTRPVYDVSIKHPQFVLPLQSESNGTLNLMRMLIAFSRVLNNEMILICDEPETSIHPNLFRELVKMFVSKEFNSNSQMLCATHATEILDLKLLRRDQLFFASIDRKDRSTISRRLSDFNGIRTTDKIDKSFLSGEYK